MDILTNLLSAEQILNLAFQCLCVLLLGWFFLQIFRHKGAPFKGWISFVVILILLLLPVLHFTFASSDLFAFGFHLPIKLTETPLQRSGLENAVSGEVKTEHQVALNKSFSFSDISYYLRSNLIKIINVLGVCWALGFLGLIARLFYGTASLWLFKRELIEIQDKRLFRILDGAEISFAKSSRTRIFQSPNIRSPISLGFFRSFIVLPQGLHLKLSDSEIKGILLHELSHIHHRDQLTGFIQRLVTALNWWNPLVYGLSAEHSRAREEISDNHVLLENDSQEYAKCLINLADNTAFVSRMPVLTGLASPHIPLKDRVNKILSKERIMETHLKKSTVAFIVLVSVLLFGAVVGNRLTFAIDDSDVTSKAIEETRDLVLAQDQEKKPPVRAVGDIKPPKLIKKVDPEYPEEAREEGIEGIVIIEATTDVYGRVVETKVLRSVPELDEAALEAVKQWVYEPMIIDGEPIGVIFTVTCVFKLKDKAEKDKADIAEEMTDAEDEKVGKPRPIKKVDPIYPEEARKSGVEGNVVLKAQIDTYGRVERIGIIKSDNELLNKAAVDALRQWVYEPFIKDGKPEKTEVTVTIKFKLSDKKKK